jgi:membrane protease subunit HflK
VKRVLLLLLFALTAWSASGVYFVQPDEIVLVRRCGQLLATPREPGAHWGLPWGIDRPERLKPREVKRVSIGLVSLAGEASGGAVTEFLSGDRNLVNVRAIVQYTISEPVEYVRQREAAELLVMKAAEASLASVLARQSIDRILTQGKTEIAALARDDLQDALLPYELGVSVRSVELGSLEPPLEVAPAFAEVVAAQRTRERTINEAHSSASETVAQAASTAQQLVNQAEGEREFKVKRALGEAQRFERMLVEYKQAPDLTARRIYWEAMAEILPRLKSKLLLDRGQQLDLTVFGAEDEKP